VGGGGSQKQPPPGSNIIPTIKSSSECLGILSSSKCIRNGDLIHPRATAGRPSPFPPPANWSFGIPFLGVFPRFSPTISHDTRNLGMIWFCVFHMLFIQRKDVLSLGFLIGFNSVTDPFFWRKLAFYWSFSQRKELSKVTTVALSNTLSRPFRILHFANGGKCKWFNLHFSLGSPNHLWLRADSMAWRFRLRGVLS